MNRRSNSLHVLLVVLVICLAGCAGLGGESATSESPANTSADSPDAPDQPAQQNDSNDNITDQSPTDEESTETSSEQPTMDADSDASSERGPTAGTEWTVTVTRVIDGDSIEARFPNGEVDTIRLLGVDTPETGYNSVSPGEFEGISDTTAGRDHLLNWGENATQVATERLSGSEVRVVVDEEAGRRGYYGRLLAYIYVDGENFNEQLLSEGYARLYESEFSKRTTFEAAEEAAQENSVGLWAFDGETTEESSTDESASASTQIAIATIHADADGNDHENLNDEYIVFENTGGEPIDLGGWAVADAAGATYQIPTGFTLESGDSVTLYTGSGPNSDAELYWGAGRAVWNNGGDTITLEDENGNVVLESEY